MEDVLGGDDHAVEVTVEQVVVVGREVDAEALGAGLRLLLVGIGADHLGSRGSFDSATRPGVCTWANPMMPMRNCCPRRSWWRAHRRSHPGPGRGAGALARDRRQQVVGHGHRLDRPAGADGRADRVGDRHGGDGIAGGDPGRSCRTRSRRRARSISSTNGVSPTITGSSPARSSSSGRSARSAGWSSES